LIGGRDRVEPHCPHQRQVLAELGRHIAYLDERTRVEVRCAQMREDHRRVHQLARCAAQQLFDLARVTRIHQRGTDADNYLAFARQLARIQRHGYCLQRDPVKCLLDLTQRVEARHGGGDHKEADRDKSEQQPSSQSGHEPE